MSTAPVMSITDELVAELEVMGRHLVSLGCDKQVVELPKLLALLAERAELKRDAARYRHASKRESDGDVDICICKVGWNSSGSADYAILTGDNAHTAIDAAMQAAQ